MRQSHWMTSHERCTQLKVGIFDWQSTFWKIRLGFFCWRGLASTLAAENIDTSPVDRSVLFGFGKLRIVGTADYVIISTTNATTSTCYTLPARQYWRIWGRGTPLRGNHAFLFSVFHVHEALGEATIRPGWSSSLFKEHALIWLLLFVKELVIEIERQDAISPWILWFADCGKVVTALLTHKSTSKRDCSQSPRPGKSGRYRKSVGPDILQFLRDNEDPNVSKRTQNRRKKWSGGKNTPVPWKQQTSIALDKWCVK